VDEKDLLDIELINPDPLVPNPIGTLVAQLFTNPKLARGNN
jgi:hypothetical protein